MAPSQGRILSAFTCAAVVLLVFNSRSIQPTQLVDYRPSTASIWNSATDAMTSAASSLGLMDSSMSTYSESATADALEAFHSLSSSGFGASSGSAHSTSSSATRTGAAVAAGAAAAGAAAAGAAADGAMSVGAPNSGDWNLGTTTSFRR